MLMYSANIYFWKRYRVNYTFIFGFKQGTELGDREVFLVSTGLAVLAFVCFLLNLQLDMDWRMKHHKTLPEVIPLCLATVRYSVGVYILCNRYQMESVRLKHLFFFLQIVLFILFCPFNIIYRSSRFFFIRSLFHCICAPLYEVIVLN